MVAIPGGRASIASMAYALVADIGGTHARFALTDPGAAQPALQQVQCLSCADYPGLLPAIEHYLGQIGQRPRSAALALAGPVEGEILRLTNRDWTFSRRQLAASLDLERLVLLNDFGAIGHALPLLGAGDLVALQGDPTPPTRGPISVVGPGTGLGVALLLGDRDQGWQVVETEGGHAGFAPTDAEELRIAHELIRRYGRASNERLLCGAGLTLLDAQRRAPAALVAAALDAGEPQALRALERFCAILGSVAGDIVLIHGARQLVLAGGIVPRILPFLATSPFRQRFLAKGRFSVHLEGVGIHAITHPWPGLLGAASVLRQ